MGQGEHFDQIDSNWVEQRRVLQLDILVSNFFFEDEAAPIEKRLAGARKLALPGILGSVVDMAYAEIGPIRKKYHG